METITLKNRGFEQEVLRDSHGQFKFNPFAKAHLSELLIGSMGICIGLLVFFMFMLGIK